MVSELAMGDIQDLQAEGLHLCPVDIIRLNELGLRVERSATSGDILAAPRIGWAQDIPIYEPTLQSEAWIDTYASRWFSSDEDSFTACVLFACANAQVRGFFTRTEMHDRASVMDSIRDWHQSLPVTAAELQRALQYALQGCESGCDIYPEPSQRPQTEDQNYSMRTAADYRTLVQDELIASGVGLSIDDMQLISESRLMGILDKHMRNQGVQNKQTNYKAHAEYARTLAVIKAKAIEAKAIKAQNNLQVQ